MGMLTNRYSNDCFRDIIIYFMKTVLYLEKSGIEELPLKNHFQEPLKSYLDLALELLIDGQPPETADLILSAEYDALLSRGLTVEQALNLRAVKELSLHIHYDSDYYNYLLSLNNLWGNEAQEFACRTFYPNLPEEIKIKYQIYDLIKYIPQEAFQLDFEDGKDSV